MQSSIIISNDFGNLKNLYKPVITFDENIGSFSLIFHNYGLDCIDYKYKIRKFDLYDDLDLTMFFNFGGSDYSFSLLKKSVAFIAKLGYKKFAVNWFVEYKQSVFFKYEAKIKCGGQKAIFDGYSVKGTINLYPNPAVEVSASAKLAALI